MPRPHLQILFCERYNCAAEAYEERAFWRCLYWHARLLAPALRRLQPGVFDEDFKLVRYLGVSTDFQEAATDIMEFRTANQGNWNFWRTFLRIRVSGRKAGKLAKKLFANRSRGDFKASTQ